MCGIIAILSRPSQRAVPDAARLRAIAADVTRTLAATERPLLERLERAAARIVDLDGLLRGPVGVTAVLAVPGLAERLCDDVGRAQRLVRTVERDLDASAAPTEASESLNRALVALKDGLWAVGRDRLPTASAVADLSGGGRGAASLRAYHDVHLALSALNRLEVRGRDSAGLHVLVRGHGLGPGPLAAASGRADRLFRSGAVRVAGDTLSFVYKAAAEIGQLGDNTRALRHAVAQDDLLRAALAAETAEVAVLGHTRWASVGLVSEPNAHPLDEDEAAGDSAQVAGEPVPYLMAALNGDVDNHEDLVRRAGLRIAPEITTDAKVIPVLAARRVAAGESLVDAFRSTVATFEGSVAIGLQSAAEPHRLLLACRGSGQGLFVGLAEDAFVVASEPYGLVEVADRYLRLDGEAVARGATVPGQVLALDAARAGEVEGLARWDYAGVPLPVHGGHVTRTEVTTRDIDRADEPHFLLKEIRQSPESVRKTLRGKLHEERGWLRVHLDEATLPGRLRTRLARGEVRRVLVVGQGTAAVAGQALVVALQRALRSSSITPQAVVATELSGFGLQDDMSDTLVVAVSQSGTTTDTNRTVDLLRTRGATVLAIVNRRNSDLVEKADGVLYTADGRDVEMSVASTKAFYAQVAAGTLLAVALAEAAGELDSVWGRDVLRGLRALPDAMVEVLERRKEIAEIAARLAPPRRSWALVGNGPNLVTARELRIKLSELCYRSIAVDATEDKKHIDLSAEPLVLVCAAGLPPAVARDVAKEVAIYKAHKAAPVVLATEGSIQVDEAVDVIALPSVHPDLDFVLAAVAGHLFGYEAALAIDAQARLMRLARDAVQSSITAERAGADLLATIRLELGTPALAVLRELTAGRLDGHLNASTAARVVVLLRHALDERGLERYSAETGRPESPTALLGDLTAALTAGIDELTRPVDAIKHQAKTVTVGTSRSEDDLHGARLARAVAAGGAPREHLSYRCLRSLAALEPAVVAVVGHTRYAVGGDCSTLRVVQKGGVALGLVSRADGGGRLVGTKHRAVAEREVTFARGHDGRTVLLVPETRGGAVTGLTLLHVTPAERLRPSAARDLLTGYRNRYAAVVDAVMESEVSFDDGVLGEVDVADLLTEPVALLAQRFLGSDLVASA